MDWLSFCSRHVIRLNFQSDKLSIAGDDYPLPEGWEMGDAFTQWQELALFLQKIIPRARKWKRKVAVHLPLKEVVHAAMVLPAGLHDEQIEAEIKMALNQDNVVVNFTQDKHTSSQEITIRYVAVQQSIITNWIQCITQAGWQMVSLSTNDVSLPLYPSRMLQQRIEKKSLQRGLIFGSCLALFVLVGWHGYQAIQLNQLTDDIAKLQTDLQQTADAKAASITNQINASLSTRQALWHLLQLFNQFDKQQVCMKELAIHATDVVIKGRTRSAASLSAFLENWQMDGLFTQVNINQLDQLPNQMAVFSLQAKRNAE